MKNLKKQILKITAFAVTALFVNFTVTAQDWGTQDTTSQDTTQTETSPQDQNMRIDTTSQEEFQGRTETTPQEQNQRIDEPSSGTFGTMGSESSTMGSESSISKQDHDNGIEYSEEIEKDELPEEVNSSLQELYPSHEISEAYRGDDDSFKVKVKNQDDEAVVYYSSEGSFERARNLSGLQQEGAFPQEQGQRTQEGLNQDDDMLNQGTQQGTQDSWGTGTDNQGTQQGSQDDWGTGTDNQGTQQGTQGTQQGTEGQWGTGSDQDNEGSAYPQEQNQRSDEDIESDDREWGTGTGTQNETGTGTGTQSETGTGTQSGTGTGVGTQGQSDIESETDTTNINSGSDSW